MTLHYLGVSQHVASEANCGLSIGRIVVIQSYVTSQKNRFHARVPGLGWASVCFLANDLLHERKVVVVALHLSGNESTVS